MPEEQIVSSEPPFENLPARAEPRDFALTPTQEQALQQLAAGNGIVSVARSVGVHRRTIARWLRSDPHFAAAYNAWRKETVASGQARLLAMADMALDTVQSAMLQGNARVAVQVAKATGVMDAPKPGFTEPARIYRQKRLRDAKWQKEVAAAELHEAFNKRSRESHRHPGHCDYMIDTYIKCRTEALRDESPDNRARRLEEQPKYHRNYLPITLRLFADLDAEAAAAPSDPMTGQPPVLDRPTGKKASGEPSGNPELLTWRERDVLEQLRRKMLGEAVEVEEVTLAAWEVNAINAAREKLLDNGFIPEADGRVVPGPRDPCGSGKPIGNRQQLESKAVPPRALPAPSPAPPPAPHPAAPPDPAASTEPNPDPAHSPRDDDDDDADDDGRDEQLDDDFAEKLAKFF